jgi:hypothetical protein
VSRRFPAVSLAALVVLAGCSGDPGPTALPPGPSAPATTATATPGAATTSPAPAAAPSTGTRRSPIRWLGPSASGPAAAVQAATRGYWSMVVRLAESPDPEDPELPRLAADPQLTSLVTLFTDVRQQGIAQRGPVDGTVTVTAVSGGGATARTCLDQTLTKVYDRAGRARPGSTGTVTLFTVSLRRSGGTWKVTGVTGRDNACTTR